MMLRNVSVVLFLCLLHLTSSERARRQTLNFFNNVPVEAQETEGGSNSTSDKKVFNFGSTADNSKNSSKSEDNSKTSNNTGNPQGQMFDFGGNTNWEDGKDVDVVNNFNALLPPGSVSDTGSENDSKSSGNDEESDSSPSGMTFNFGSNSGPGGGSTGSDAGSGNVSNSTGDTVKNDNSPNGMTFAFPSSSGGDGASSDNSTKTNGVDRSKSQDGTSNLGGQQKSTAKTNGLSSGGNSNVDNPGKDGTDGGGNPDDENTGNPEGQQFDFGGSDADWKNAKDAPVVGLPPGVALPSLGVEDSNTTEQTNCPFDICAEFSPCKSPQKCVLTSFCEAVCVGDTPETPIPKAPAPPDTNSTLRPRSERKCPNSPFVCQYGYCNDTTCICDEGWQGFTCNKLCTLGCVHGVCQVLDNSTFCNCYHDYEGPRCEHLKPDPEEKARALATILSAALGTAFGVALLLAVIIPIILWRMRVIFVLKLVYYFKEYEDEDGKLFDAYVSLTPTPKSEKFVYGSLRPRLENLGFKLYLQARDSPANEVMSEIILKALEKSRRTIMVVTSDYVTNEWNRFEYLIAQHETLQLRQRIIPVILEDIDKEQIKMDTSLRHILDSIKCLRFPHPKPNTTGQITSPSISIVEEEQNKGFETISPTTSESPLASPTSKEAQKQEKREEKFWKRLELTMPKKKKDVSSSSRPSRWKLPHLKSKGKSSEDMSAKIESGLSSVTHSSKSHPLDFEIENSQKNNSSDISKNFLDINIMEIFEQDQSKKPSKHTLQAEPEIKKPTNGVEFHNICLEAEV